MGSEVKKASQLEPPTPTQQARREELEDGLLEAEDWGEWGRVRAHPQSWTAFPSPPVKYGAAGPEATSGGGRQVQMAEMSHLRSLGGFNHAKSCPFHAGIYLEPPLPPPRQALSCHLGVSREGTLPSSS